MKRSLGKMLVGNILATAAIRFRDAPAIYCASTGRRFSFRAIDDRANRLARALLSAGYKKGDVVAFLSSNRAEIVEIYFALARTGIVGLPLNYRLAAREMFELMRAMGASGLIVESKFAAVAEQARGLRHIIQFGGEKIGFALDYETLLAAATPAAPDIEIDEADPYYFNLTSGTTGLPKSYVLTQYNNSTLSPLFQAFDMTSRDVAMTVFPAFGRVGFAWIAGSLLYGVPHVLANFEPNEVLRLIAAERVTIFNLVPTMAAMLLPAQAAAPRDLNSVRAIVFAGSSLPASIRDETIAKLCPQLYEYYGMQETGALVVSTPEDRRRRPESVGKQLAFAEVRIAGDDGRTLEPNQLGEILGRSPNAVAEYFDNPEKSAETFRDGWVHTGDLGSLDEEGYLTIRGRKKDMIVTGGQNVHAAEVEEIILQCPGVAECAVFGLPDDLWGERVTGLVVAQKDADITPERLEEFCRRHLAGFKTPKKFIVEETPLPRTPTGKVQKFLLVARFTRRA
ncbi:class I adenylate-forming enzyme family protein [Methylocapsa sp. S129]|uniref:class I adenylate-forming enzyme family protein n=1 Tax=Methylocapsa sp. S129 TaxID=1641869 RepID=UPI00131E23E1|nr:AMP-binding protein [Methylocapsa sp. S129]